MAFKAIEAFQKGQEYYGPDVWQKYEEFDMDILDFSDTPMHLLYLGIKIYIISMIPTHLKQRLRQNQDFAWLASKSFYLCRENALYWCNANKFTNKNGSVSTKGWESSHYQAFTRWNEDQLKCNSYKSLKQLSVL